MLTTVTIIIIIIIITITPTNANAAPTLLPMMTLMLVPDSYDNRIINLKVIIIIICEHIIVLLFRNINQYEIDLLYRYIMMVILCSRQISIKHACMSLPFFAVVKSFSSQHKVLTTGEECWLSVPVDFLCNAKQQSG